MGGSYGGYVGRLARKVRARLTDIEAVHNFDLGPEFEVAMCHLLADILPARYGICRGFVVSAKGDRAGDDLIIFDRMQYPTLRSSAGADFSMKDQVPIEAVYAYLECKHSIKEASTFDEALRQASAVKDLLLSRIERINHDYEKNGPLYGGKERDWPRTWPRRKNQPFTMIVARHWTVGVMPQSSPKHPADLAVLGDDHVMTHRAVLGPDGIKGCLFHDESYGTSLGLDRVPQEAFGLGLLALMQALSWIELVPIDWFGCLNEAFWRSLSSPSDDG